MRRVNEPRRNFAKRRQHKCTLRQPRMRNLEPWFAYRQSIHQQNVKVERPRAIHKARRPVPAKLKLDLEQRVEQRTRRQIGFQFDYGIHKSWLLGKTNRLGRIE